MSLFWFFHFEFCHSFPNLRYQIYTLGWRPYQPPFCRFLVQLERLCNVLNFQQFQVFVIWYCGYSIGKQGDPNGKLFVPKHRYTQLYWSTNFLDHPWVHCGKSRHKVGTLSSFWAIYMGFAWFFSLL